ncbi:MAG: vanadium-dependent haloperoxidase [Saprospiraceae bacterium]|nr:vanadium-dependent haloperoxidase [Saprospiraceae bacterium]
MFQNSHNTKFLLPLLLIALLFIASCSKDNEFKESPETREYTPQHVYSYFNLTCKMLKGTQGFFPPQAARAYSYISLANYESVVHGIKDAKSLHTQLNGFSATNLPKPQTDQVYNWAIASNSATSRTIQNMFEKRLSPVFKTSLDSIESTHLILLSAGEEKDVVERSIQFGYQMADAVFEYSKNDGGHESYLDPFYLPYGLPSDEYCWVPTGATPNPLSPKWGKNRPFIIENITKTHPGPPVTFSKDPNSAFYKEAMVVYNQLKNNSPEQIEIAKYWADDPFKTCTPAGHTFNILLQVLQNEKVSLAKASLGLVKMGLAENDAFIACWKTKYEYVLLRPVTYIQRYIDPTFTTILGTPPFPAYTSGHSCEIGAGSRILTDLFTNGNGDYQFTDYSQLQHGFVARSFSNFETMAEECANSRLYGGIHYPMDNSKGLQTGRAIGDNVNNLIQWPFFIN